MEREMSIVSPIYDNNDSNDNDIHMPTYKIHA
jgi:hypothetical protein